MPDAQPDTSKSDAIEPLHVVLDGIVFSLQRHGGISETFARLLEQWRDQPVRLSLLLYPGSENNLPLQALETAGLAQWSNLKIVRLNTHPGWARWRRVDTRTLDAGIFHSSYYRLPAQAGRYRVVTTMHDFMHLRYKSVIRKFFLNRLIRAAILGADAVICVSGQTRERLKKTYSLGRQQLSVTTPGVAPDFHTLEPGLPGNDGLDHALFLGQRGGYKNFRMAVLAVAQVPDLQLTIIGGGALSAEEEKLLQKFVPGRYRHLGWVSNTELNRLYNVARALIYPSAEEGFGMPVLEASCAGCPVITVAGAVAEEAGSLPELRIAEADAAALPALLRRLGQDQVLRSALKSRAQQLRRDNDWARAAARVLQVYRELGPSVGQAAV